MSAIAGRLAVCTAITRSFASFARVLARSAAEAHPQIPMFAAVTERTRDLERWREPGFASVPIETLGVPDLLRQAFLNQPQELTVLAKPFIMRHLLDQGFDTVVFLDADILVLDDLSPLFTTCAAHAITLAPHLLSPPYARPIERELDIVRAGTFNGGFIAVTARPDARRFLDWWMARLLTHNRLEPHAGLHNDQRWLDLVPGFFDDVAIVRDPGCNVAYWNLPERGLRQEGTKVSVAGGPCRFFHFSGFDPHRPEVVSKHSSRVARAELGDAASVFDRYVHALEEAGFDETSHWPYSFGTFDTGVPIPRLARTIYRDMGDEVRRFGDPFQAARPDSYLGWLLTPDLAEGSGQGLAPLWRTVYRARRDLQQAFPDPAGVDAEPFRRWVRDSGLAEYAVDPSLALTAPS